MRLERQKAIEAVVTLSRGRNSPTLTESEKGTINETDSEQESELSQGLEDGLPDVTPGTSDEII